MPNQPSSYPSLVLTNPPFGKKSSITVIGENGSKEREDISYAAPGLLGHDQNKQLNFLQHIKTLLGDHRPSRRRRAGQRAVRGRRR